VTDAVITASDGDETEAEAAERAIDEKAYGFWIYLMSDAIIFALLFATFVVMSHNTADGPGGHTLFRLPHTFAETMLLLASSTTFGFASVAIAAGQRWRTLIWLGVTVLRPPQNTGSKAGAQSFPSSHQNNPQIAVSATIPSVVSMIPSSAPASFAAASVRSNRSRSTTLWGYAL